MPAKPEGLVQHFLREALRALRLDQRRHQRDRVIGERGGAHRILAEAGAIAGGEIAKAGRHRGPHTRHPASWGLAKIAHRPTGRCREAARAWYRCRSRPASARPWTPRRAPSGMKMASAPARRLRHVAHRALHLGPVERVALERHDAAAPPRHRLLERRLDHRAIGIVRDERGERALSLAGGITDDAVDVGFRQEAQEIHAARGDIGVGRERDHRHAARAREPVRPGRPCARTAGRG